MTTETEEGFGGLPSATAAPAVASQLANVLPGATQQERAYDEFTIPKKLVGAKWKKSGRDDSELVFGITEIEPEQEQRASSLTGAQMNFMMMLNEQQIMCLYVIGGKHTKGNRQTITSWLKDIGPIGRKVVERCYSEINSAEEVDLSAVASAGQPKLG